MTTFQDFFGLMKASAPGRELKLLEVSLYFSIRAPGRLLKKYVFMRQPVILAKAGI